MTFISGVEATLGSAGGDASGDGCGGDSGWPRPHPRPQLVCVLTMIDHVSWKQHHIISF